MTLWKESISPRHTASSPLSNHTSSSLFWCHAILHWHFQGFTRQLHFKLFRTKGQWATWPRMVATSKMYGKYAEMTPISLGRRGWIVIRACTKQRNKVKFRSTNCIWRHRNFNFSIPQACSADLENWSTVCNSRGYDTTYRQYGSHCAMIVEGMDSPRRVV